MSPVNTHGPLPFRRAGGISVAWKGEATLSFRKGAEEGGGGGGGVKEWTHSSCFIFTFYISLVLVDKVFEDIFISMLLFLTHSSLILPIWYACYAWYAWWRPTVACCLVMGLHSIGWRLPNSIDLVIPAGFQPFLMTSCPFLAVMKL